MIVYLKLFGELERPGNRGSDPLHFDIPQASTAGELLAYAHVPLQTVRLLLVNGVHAGQGDILKDGDIVSVFPPVAGG